MSFSIRRTPRTSRGYVEPLLNAPNGLPLHIVLIPAGSFIMGSPDDEPERVEWEGPQHEVLLSKFFMGRYPVTQAQWHAVAKLPQAERELDPDPSRFKGENHPVEQVSWFEAVEFCDRLTQHTGRPYRLPTEAEWEYACRAGTTTPFYFGKTLTPEVANYNGDETYADGPKGEYRALTTPVDRFGIANAFGLSDMHGNVFEWCQDHWRDNYQDTPTDGSAWLSTDEKSSCVYRGGSWGSVLWNCRSAYRSYYRPGNRSFGIGFRVCCSAPSILPTAL